MKRKKDSNGHSQIIGIVWLSVALAIFVLLVIFSRHNGRPADNSSDLSDTTIANLSHQEDSAYQIRRKEKNFNVVYDKPTHNSPTKEIPTEQPNMKSNITRQPLVVELNSSDTITLQLLHGIGPTFADRIVRYRNRLGGFVSTDQLLEVYGFSPELLAHIAPYIKVDTTQIRTIPINTIALKELIRHPYVEYYQARDIVRLRQQGILIHSIDDLRAVPSMTDSTIEKLIPYIDFSIREE